MVRKLPYEAANSILTRTRQTLALKGWALKVVAQLRKSRVALTRRLAAILHAMLREAFRLRHEISRRCVTGDAPR